MPPLATDDVTFLRDLFGEVFSTGAGQGVLVFLAAFAGIGWASRWLPKPQQTSNSGSVEWLWTEIGKVRGEITKIETDVAENKGRDVHTKLDEHLRDSGVMKERITRIEQRLEHIEDTLKEIDDR